MSRLHEEKVEQETTGVETPKVLLIVVVGVVIAVGTVGWAWLLLPVEPPLGKPPAQRETAREEVGNIWIYDFDRRALGLERRAEDLEHLDSYGWVDREAGIAHIPIDEAMKLYLESSRAQFGQRLDGPEAVRREAREHPGQGTRPADPASKRGGSQTPSLDLEVPR